MQACFCKTECLAAVRFYDDIVYDREYNGLVLDDDEGQLRPIFHLLCSCLPLGSWDQPWNRSCHVDVQYILW